jgi:hypothetical protein
LFFWEGLVRSSSGSGKARERAKRKPANRRIHPAGAAHPALMGRAGTGLFASTSFSFNCTLRCCLRSLRRRCLSAPPFGGSWG